jgi:protein TonB
MRPQCLSFDTAGAGIGARPSPVASPRSSPVALVAYPAPAAFVRYGASAAPRAHRRAILGAMLALHVLAIVGLMNISGVRESMVDVAPIFLAVLAPPPPAAAPGPLPPPPPRNLPSPPQLALPLIAPEPSPSVSPLVAQVAAPVAPAPAVQAPEAPPPAPAPALRTIPTSAVQYLVPPVPVYSRTSARMKESGKVVVRVFIDEQGQPRDVQVSQSAGFARLDDAAVAAVKKTRFKPCIENGVAISGWAFIPIAFELQG